MFGFFKRANKAPAWKDLPAERQALVAGRIQKAVKAMWGARYKLVSPPDIWQRPAGQTERFGEDHVLNVYGRGRMLDQARNAARNSPTFDGLLKQFDLNAVGSRGGKAIFEFDGAEGVKAEFSKWTRDADFFDGLSFNALLKLILKTYIIGGDMVLVFDDGLLEDSGKLVVYEPDEIGSTTDEAVAARYGASARQSLGRVYNGNGRFIGAVVSRSQRGAEVFDPAKCYFLRRDPDASPFDSFWMMPRNVFRVAQGRGISPAAPSLATVLDLEDLCGFELAAAKKNAQTFAQVLQESSPSNEDAAPPSPFEDGQDFSGMTDDEVEEAARQYAQASAERTVTLDRAAAAGAIYQVMPENYRMELLDTKHPNQNTPAFIDWLAGKSAAPFGLSREFATLAPTSEFRANQLFSARAFEEAQKFLEQICDWTLYRWSLWAVRRGRLAGVPEDFPRGVSWSWPRMEELDENAHQDAVAKKLKNMTGSYRDELGPDWKEKLEVIRDEIAWCKANGLAHPSYEMLSGGERTGADEQGDGL